MAEEMITIEWETAVRHRVSLPRAEVVARLRHTPEELSRRPIIDEALYPGEPDMDGSRHELAEALGRLEGDRSDNGVVVRVITNVDL